MARKIGTHPLVDFRRHYAQARFEHCEVFMKLTGKVVLTAASLTLGAVSVLPQPVISARSCLISRAQGEAFIAETAIEISQATFPEVKENAILSTKAGRAEVLLTRGVYLRIGESASFKMLTNRLIDTRLEMLTG